MISSLGAISLLFCDIPLGIRWILWIILPLTFWNSLPEAVFRHVGFMQMLTEPAFVINMSHCYFLLRFPLCWCQNLGANLVQHFMKQHKLFATIFNFGKTKSHDTHDFQRYYTI